MTRLLLRALTTANLPALEASGLGAGALVRVAVAEVAGWASPFEEFNPKPRFGRADLLHHHQIVLRLNDEHEACLPARFPTWFADERALATEIEGRHAELSAALQSVRGQCELAITAVWTVPPPETPSTRAATSGTQYLRGRQQALAGSEERRIRALGLADDIERLVGADLIAVRRQVCPSTHVALSSALLIARANARDVLARLPCSGDGVRILVNGPWPPYTFAASLQERQHKQRPTQA